jgi:hypothetical protein
MDDLHKVYAGAVVVMIVCALLFNAGVWIHGQSQSFLSSVIMHDAP